MQFARDFIEDLLIRVPISEIIGQHVSWDKRKTSPARGDYWACCPFHEEKTPSFHCDDRKGYYYCFSCNAKGDHFSFLSTFLGCSFTESVQKIADMAGIPLPISNPLLKKKEKERVSSEAIMEMAAHFFQDTLQSQDSIHVRRYLDERGINTHSIETFRLGYAPDSRNALRQYLLGQGISQEKISATGLVVHGENIATPYDRFRDRLIFPILSPRGKVIAFGGRSLSEGATAKYLNSPETDFFHKGEMLYNFFGALNHSNRRIAREGQRQISSPIILVEGYVDVIALHQIGIQNVVSPLGTALTEHQLKLLWRLSSHIVLCFDGDAAGLRASYKAIDLVLCHVVPGKSVNFILLPDDDDPDSFVRRSGKKAFEKLIAESFPLVAWLWKRATDDHSFETPDARAELEIYLGKAIKSITNKKLQYYYSKDIRNRLNKFFQRDTTPYSSERYGKNQRFYSKSENKQAPSQRLTQSSLVRGVKAKRPSLREATLLLTLINHPKILQEEYQELIDIRYDNRELQKLWSFLFSEFIVTQEFSREEIYKKLCARGFGELLKSLDRQIRDAGLWTATGEANLVDVRQGYKQALEFYKCSRLLS
ncbi:DNA primase, partial [Candidatus Liberibacter sp.]|uniref:DNA primase n=1 Tax=Candidatus Liberibacter sp. TaxID=34022 RepID=UPI0015F7613C